MMYSSDPILQWHLSENRWELIKSFAVKWKDNEWVIPVGFRTDLASVPRLFRGLIPKIGKHIQPAIVHDYFYERGGITKAEADMMFLDGMKYVGVSWWRRKAMYVAVRIGGTGIWD